MRCCVHVSVQANNSQRPSFAGDSPTEDGHDRSLALDDSGEGGSPGTAETDDANASFTAIGATFQGPLNWNLISRITRAQWEKSMASCCLGIVMQHRLEFNNQVRCRYRLTAYTCTYCENSTGRQRTRKALLGAWADVQHKNRHSKPVPSYAA